MRRRPSDLALRLQGGPVTAIDPYEESVIRAKKSIPEGLQGRVEIMQAAFDQIPASSGPSAFDTVILSWSLC